MKRIEFAATVYLMGTAFGTAAFVQGRHDETPHGRNKAAARMSGAKTTAKQDTK